ncbi:hypothetical protein AB0L85_21240 [Streptomyces sp. NPDC052051]|uniref:hypothetical protein n=1 Tax=Streptomyces sp. NPDC052051 TaxID=3154649 RepID=UPI00343EFE03
MGATGGVHVTGEAGESVKRSGWRGVGKRKLLAGGAALVLLAALAGTWATRTWPFTADESYCWGAWRENSGPEFLGGAALDDGNGRRTGTEEAPTQQHPTGTCAVAIDTWHSFGDDDKITTRVKVNVDYGPVPKPLSERATWVADHLGGDALPLPDGLPGVVHSLGGAIVLPKRCDAPDGRPTVVTLTSHATDTWSKGTSAGRVGLGGTRSVAALLVAAANHGMKAAGCEAGRPYKLVSPMLQLPEKTENFVTDDVCRIPGLTVDKAVGDEVEYQVGAVDRDLQSCSLRLERGEGRVYDGLMVAQPRLADLLDGVTGDRPPAPGWRGTGVFKDDYGIVRADCAGRPATFVMLFMSSERQKAFTDAVTQRLGCAPLAPRHTPSS